MKSSLFIFLVGIVALPMVFADSTAPKQQPEKMQHRGERAITVALDDTAEAVLWNPDLSTVPLTINNGKITLPKTGVDNYHAIVAKQRDDNSENVVIRYVYRHGKPSGHSTSELTAQNKADLEIIPDPVPREHSRYYSKQVWDFIVKFKGQPLVQHPVMLNTSNGTIMLKKSDDYGRVSFKLPDDFSQIAIGERDRRKAELHIVTELTLDNEKWFTQLDSDYSVSESYWRLTFLGVIVMVIGFMLGVLFIRRNNIEAGKK